MSSESDEVEIDPKPEPIDISPEQNKKLLKTIIEPGEGEEETPLKGDHIYVHYIGRLPDGNIFDSSVHRDEEFQFILGKGHVLKAWDIGVATMKLGEKSIFLCHPDFAYGKKGLVPRVPENATVTFEIQLLSWELEDLTPEKDGGVLKSLLDEGEGETSPSEGATVDVHLVGTCDDKVFEERDVKFILGEGIEVGIVKGIEVALKHFKKGERSIIHLSPQYAFGAEGILTTLKVSGKCQIEYTVTLKSFEKEKESWNMTAEEKLEQAEIVKRKGTRYFKDEKIEAAEKQYKKIIKYLENDIEIEEEIEKKNLLLLAGYLNLAACYIKLEKYHEVIQNCDKALKINPTSSKGLFRKGQALMELKDYEVAKDYFNKVLKVDKVNKAAKKNICICNEHIKKQLHKDKQLYQAIFNKNC